MDTGKVDILCPVYINHPSLYPIVSEFFESLKYYPEFNLIVCNDSSPLPLMPMWPVHYTTMKNLGYTHAVNVLMSMSKADIMVVCNDDLKFEKGDLDWVYNTKGIWFPRDSASANLDQFGAIWAIDRPSFEKLGYLDERYPHYGSDRAYYLEAVKKGVPIVKVNDVCVQHHESATYKNTNLK